MADTAIVDVDGTLVDTNYHHALAWFRAFRRFDITKPVWEIHRAIGMGGDQIVAHLAGSQVERQLGDDLRAASGEQFAELIDEVRPFAGAHDLLADVRDRGFRIVLASSGKQHDIEHMLDLLDARGLADAWTTSSDVEATKPAPDLLEVALAKVDGAGAVMIGDSTWDCLAAGKLGIPTLAVRTGGFSVDELTDAGAAMVCANLVEMRDRLDETPLAAAD
ncbi:HAD family hydrolase [Nakamurella sp.]|uniref:HAD family hydrolase n=1 Tax=Nakamurella sp. TaxID=1869182 RepID=UPI003783C301